jgi:MFS family permease
MSSLPTARRAPGAGFVVVNTVLLLLSTAVAALAWWPVYQDSRFVIAIAAAAVLGSIVAILGAVFRWRSYIVILVGFAVLLLTGVPLAVPDQAIAGFLPSFPGILDLLAGIALGWKQLLTIALPVGAYQALLVPPFVLVLASSIVALSVALRAKWGELAVIPPVVVFLTGIAFGPEKVAWPIPAALGLLAVVLLWLVWRRWRRRRETIRSLALATEPAASDADTSFGVRNLVAGGVLLAVAATASIGAAAVLPPSSERDVLRTEIAQPFDPRDYPSPLAGFRRYLRDDRAGDTMFTVTGLPADGRIRIATLDSYDGVVYAVGSDAVDSASGTFVRIPAGVDQSDVAGTPVELEISIDGYNGVWLPTVGLFESVGFEGDRAARLRDAFYYNDTSATAAVIGGLVTGDAYTLDAVIPDQPTLQQLDDVTPGSADVPRLGTLPDELALALDGYIEGISDPGARLVAALSGIKEEGYISHGLSDDEPPSRSGHAADRITELFTAPRMIGDAEQYAVAAALMARQLGFPARVVFGFLPQGDGDTLTVHGDDVTAWIEVDTAEYGWVTLDPFPLARPIP